MAAVSRSRGYGISKADMEASRLVFVFVQDAKPKRKVAVPVPDGYTWSDFTTQVKTKLKIAGVKEIYLANSGQRVSSLDELQDIDELCVVEGQEAPAYSNGNAGAGSSEADLRAGMASTSEINPQNGEYMHQYHQGDKHKVVAADSAVTIPGKHDDDEGKYTRRAHPLKRTLQRLFPMLFTPSLPVTTKDVPDKAESTRPGTKRRKGRRSFFNARTILMLLAVCMCLATMFWFFFKVNVKLQ